MPRTAASYRIDPFDLRLFAAVAEAGSITAGARQIHLSLAAASTRLQTLEHAIGAQLFQRSKQGVRLTDAGQTLLRHAGRLQREMESLHAEMAAHAHGVRSTVRMLGNTAAMSEYLPRLLGRFLAAHSEIDIDLRELGSQDVLLSMRQERAEIGIVADYVETAGLRVQPFREDRLVAVLPTAMAESVSAPLHFDDLVSRPFVGLVAESGLSRFLQRQALKQGRGMHHRLRVGSFEAVLSLVADGVGVAIVPASAALRLVSAQVCVLPLADQWASRRLLLCTAAEEALGPAAAELLRFMAAPD